MIGDSVGAQRPQPAIVGAARCSCLLRGPFGNPGLVGPTLGPPVCPKGRIIAHVNIEPTFKLAAIQRCPAAAATRVVVVLPFPRELKELRSLARFDTLVDPPVNGPELEFARAVAAEGNVPRCNEVDVVWIPLLHPGDPPTAHEVSLAHEP